MTFNSFRNSRTLVNDLGSYFGEEHLNGCPGYVYSGETFIQRDLSNGSPRLLLQLDGRIEYYYPETPEVLGLMEEMLFNWYLENR